MGAAAARVWRGMNVIRPMVGALVALAVAAPAASAQDAEIFATNNTAVITDPADPRLNDGLLGFERDVNRLIEDGGGLARGSQLLDGVFFSAEQGTTTLERSRVFAVDGVEDDELHTIADTVRARFGQQSVLTFAACRRPIPTPTRSSSTYRASAPRICATGCWPTSRPVSGCSAAR